jgi:hypothetical protein
MSEREVDREQIASFVDALFRYASPGQTVSLRSFVEGEQKAFGITPVKIGDAGLNELVHSACLEAQRAADAGEPTVFCPPIAGFQCEAEPWRAREQDLSEAYALSVECDQHAQQARTMLEHVLGQATVVVASGGEWINPETGEVQAKLHLHWRLSEPAAGDRLTALKQARRLATGLAEGDPSNVPAVHPLRWPGSWHRKSEPRLTRILDLKPDAEIDLADALDVLQGLTLGEGSPTEAGGEAAGARLSQTQRSTAELVSNIMSGREYHPSLVPMASRLLGGGMYPGAAVNHLRALMEAVPPERRDLRWTARNGDIPRIVDTAKAKWGANEPAVLGHEDVWDPWERSGVPDFPFDILPEEIRDFVQSHSALLGCDASALAMASLVNFSGALDHRFALMMMQQGDWRARPRLWVLLRGDPSCKKTPIVNTALRPLQAHQDLLRDEYDAAFAAHLAAGGDPKDGPDRPLRLIVADTTTEKLADILSRQDRGALVKRDEIPGWLGSMEKYGARGSAADRAFWLQAYDGGSFTVDRISRGEQRIRNLSVSLIGGIQPARLNEIRGFASDGLLQRFVPVIVGSAKFPKDVAGDLAYVRYERITRTLIGAAPAELRLAPDAADIMQAIRFHLFQLEQEAGGFADGFEAFVGKLPGVAGALALILHMIHHPRDGGGKPVSRSIVEGVQRLMFDFTLPHALEFYRSAGAETSADRIQTIASWILTSGRRRITSRDLIRNVASLKGLSLDELNKRLSPLVAGGWLRPEAPGQQNGAWAVAEAVFTQLETRARSEEERKARLAELIGSPRKRAAKAGGAR